MHHQTVHVKEGLPFAQDLLLENSEVPYLFSTDLTQFVPYFFSSIDAISSNIDELLSINSSPTEFVFDDFNAYHKDWLTYIDEIDRPWELCENFSISNSVSQMANFPTQILNCDSHSVALLNLSLLILAFAILWLSFHCGTFWSYCGLSFHWLSFKHKWRCSFSSNSLTILVLTGTVLSIHLRDILWKDIFKLSSLQN